MNIKQELRYVIKKHKDDELATFQTNISLMADACLREIIRLEEMEEVSIQNKEKIEIQQETINTLEYQILLLEEDIELKLDLIESLQEEYYRGWSK